MKSLPPVLKLFIAFVVVLSLGSVAIKLKPEKLYWSHETKLHIAASFYTLGEFAEVVGKDRVEVRVITPPGTESHDYEPSPKDSEIVNSSDIFIYNGMGFDSWAEKSAQHMGEKAINSSTFIEPIGNDPHFWLDPLSAVKIVEGIAKKLSIIDPNNGDYYTKNAQEYMRELRTLHLDYQNGLSSCNNRNIVVSHNAFSYLTSRYNINSLVIAGISPEEEPSPKYMAEIANQAKDLSVKYIFFESLVSPRLSQTIANEIGAQTLVLNPVEGLTDEDRSTGQNYITIMKANLENLRKAMQCK
jgi:zinc transport system substrate-binding protein